MNTIISIVKRHPLVTFVLLAYLLSWWTVVIAPMILPYGPFLAAIIVTALTTGRVGVKALLRRLVQWRVGLRWYVVLLVLPILIDLLVGYALVLFTGATLTTTPLSPWYGLLPILALEFLQGPLGEELGWRGYALPGLQVRRSALTASVLLGIVWTGWHLPLLFIPGASMYGFPLLAFLVYSVAFAVLYTWLSNHTNGSVLIAMLFHLSANFALTLVVTVLPDIDVPQAWWFLAAAWALVALIIVVLTGPSLTGKRAVLRTAQDETMADYLPAKV
jgi:membrane protease YdiL (CAAX protease family)